MPKSMPKRRRRNRRGKSRSINPPTTALSYTGPLHQPSAMNQAQGYCINLVYAQTIATNASGVITSVFVNNLNNTTEAADFLPVFDEYRILGGEYIIVWNNNNTYSASLLQGPIVSVIDRDNASALTSVGAAYAYESAKVHSTGRNFKVAVRMHSAEDATFMNTNPGTTNTWWVKLYASGLTPSVTYATAFVTLLMQFRGRV